MRLSTWSYNWPGIYFMTFCTNQKQSILSYIVGPGILDGPEVKLTGYGKSVQDALRYLLCLKPQWKLHNYVIMPNHVHLLLELQAGPSGMPDPTGTTNENWPVKSNPACEEIPKFVSSIKRYTNRVCGVQLWQERYYDHIIRDENDFLRIWKYIDENPAKWSDDKFYMMEE